MQVFSQACLSGSNHAELVIESIKKTGQLLRQRVHFIGPCSTKQPNAVVFEGSGCFVGKLRAGTVLITKHKEVVDFTHKSQTWLRSAEKVRLLRRDAKKERDNPLEFLRPFSILGNRSIFTAYLDTYKIIDPLVSAIANCDFGLFRGFMRSQRRLEKKPGVINFRANQWG